MATERLETSGAAHANWPLTRRESFEASAPDGRFQFGGADVWRVLVTWEGEPCAYVHLADPGATDSRQLTGTTLVRAAEIGQRRRREIDALENRLGVRPLPQDRFSCSVVLCTHRRRAFAAQAISALTRLDPAADEVILVDNAPGDEDCEAIAREAGVRYVREERVGQNWARAAGFAAARGQLIAYTDDDVVVSPGWLAALGELFADPSVGAATGVAVGRRMDTAAQDLRESFCGFVPGMTARRFDWTTLRPASAGAVGAGANMVFRRDALSEMHGLFAPELDPGTPSRSGGDLYMLYRVLAGGWRIAFDPRLYAEHEHRADIAAFRETLLAYGTGYAAFLTKALVEHAELSTLALWWWLPNRLVEALAWQPMHPHPGLVPLRWRYALGGLGGAPAWVRARHGQRGRALPSIATSDEDLPATPAGAVVPTALRGGVDEREEVHVIGASSARERNRAAAATNARILLFLSGDCSATPDLNTRHAGRHPAGEHERIVLGYVKPCPGSDLLATQLSVMWWHDHFQAKQRAAHLTFADMTDENFSLSRELFERLGGFDERLGPQAAAHELAIRALRAGVELEYEPNAVAVRNVSPDTGDALAHARRSGADHARLVALHPMAAAALPAVFGPCPAGDPRPAAARRLPLEAACRAAVPLADLLERGRMRGAWMWVFRRLITASYTAGYASAGGSRQRPAVLRLDLADDEVVPAPRVAAPMVELWLGPRRLGRLRPPAGQWSAPLVEAALDRLRRPEDWDELEHPRPSPAAMPSGDLSGTLVVFGPANNPGDDRYAAELIASGARVERLVGERSEHWALCAQLIAHAPEQHVALTLPGVSARPEWLAAARVPLAGDRVAVVCGAGVPDDRAPRPTILLSRALHRGPYRTIAHASQFMVVSTRWLTQCGGLDPAAGYFGMHGPMLELIERALACGLVVAYQETPGLDPPGRVRPTRPRLEWQRARARGGLIAGMAMRRGGIRGAALLGTQLVGRPLASLVFGTLRTREPSVRSVAGVSGGELFGAIHALATRRSWAPRRPE